MFTFDWLCSRLAAFSDALCLRVELAVIEEVAMMTDRMYTKLQRPMTGKSTVRPRWIVDRSLERKWPPNRESGGLGRH
jgi:hypothetical protein